MIHRAKIMEETDVRRAVTRIAHQIIEKNHGTEGIILLGIRRRGEPLAYMLSDLMDSIENVRVPVGVLDITMYRDDLEKEAPNPVVHQTDVGVSVDGKIVILVDDVIYTGRTARAAMEAVITLGRPAMIQLAVLVDRGHRELPIRADYVGKNVPTSRKELIAVSIPPYDDSFGVDLYEI